MFSRTERLILANQFKILAKLDPDQAIDHERSVEVLEEGYEHEYSTVIQPVSETSLSVEQCNEVINVLSLYDDLKTHYSSLSDTSGIDEDRVTFPGFDSDSESVYLSYATFLKKDPRRWEQINIKNSHTPLLNGYRRMLAARDESCIANGLTKEDIRRILDALQLAEQRHEQPS